MPGMEDGTEEHILMMELLLGSRENPECQIDSIAQSWAVISGAVNKEIR